MADEQLPNRHGRMSDITVNLVAFVLVAVGIALLVRGVWHQFWIDIGIPEEDRVIERQLAREARVMYLWAWPVFAAAAGILAHRRRYITAGLFFLAAPLAALLAGGYEFLVVFVLAAAFVTWCIVERRGRRSSRERASATKSEWT